MLTEMPLALRRVMIHSPSRHRASELFVKFSDVALPHKTLLGKSTWKPIELSLIEHLEHSRKFVILA